MRAEYSRLVKEVVAIYAWLREEMHIRELTRIEPLRRHSKYFCWPPSVNNPLSSERRQQQRPAYHETKKERHGRLAATHVDARKRS